jgi:hypothetical protein
MRLIRIILTVRFNNGEVKDFNGVGAIDGDALKSVCEMIEAYCQKHLCIVVSQELKTRTTEE